MLFLSTCSSSPRQEMIVAWTVDRKHFADRAAPPPLPKVMPVFGLCNLLSERNATSSQVLGIFSLFLH